MKIKWQFHRSLEKYLVVLAIPMTFGTQRSSQPIVARDDEHEVLPHLSLEHKSRPFVSRYKRGSECIFGVASNQYLFG